MRSAIKFMLLVLVLCASASCQLKNIELRPFASPDGRFSVLTPAAMPHKSVLTHWPGGDVVMHSYALEHDDIIYAVNYFDVPADISDGLRAQMQFNSPFPGRDALIKEQHWTVKGLREAHSRQGPDKKSELFSEGFTATSASGKQTVTVRLFWYQNRFYQVMVAHHVVPSYFQMLNAEKFINSIKIL